MRRPALLILIAIAFVAGIQAGRATGAAAEPATPQWSVAAELSQPRAFAEAVALATGEVLILGGLDPEDPRVTVMTSELFDPDTGTVTLLPQLLLGRLNQAVTVGWGDRVVVTGGTEWLFDHWGAVDRTDVYLPWSRTWMRAARMTVPRADHTATRLLDGRVLVAGGNRDATFVTWSEIYDPGTDTWARAAQLPRGRTQHSAATLPDGRVILAGGFEEDGRMTRTTLIYDPRLDTWSEGPESRELRLNHSMARLPNGDLLFFGGELGGAGTAERYDWRSSRFTYAGTLGEPRLVAQGVALADGRVVTVGGLPQGVRRTRFAPTAGAELWDPSKALWLDLPPAPTTRAYGVLVATNEGIYRISGSGLDEVAYSTIEALVWK